MVLILGNVIDYELEIAVGETNIADKSRRVHAILEGNGAFFLQKDRIGKFKVDKHVAHICLVGFQRVVSWRPWQALIVLFEYLTINRFLDFTASFHAQGHCIPKLFFV